LGLYFAFLKVVSILGLGKKVFLIIRRIMKIIIILIGGKQKKANVLWKERIQTGERQSHHPSNGTPNQQLTEIGLNVRRTKLLHNINRGSVVELSP
jgi:hypothetical protein